MNQTEWTLEMSWNITYTLNNLSSYPGSLISPPRGLFLKSLETFRAYFGCHNSLYIFATPRFEAIKLRKSPCFFRHKKKTY